ncbi:MAG: helicase-associated domain-containing protein [Caldilineaceae bacterium]|nr:helicase-associated domain-containing protein [Caldilineaceae bacterium]
MDQTLVTLLDAYNANTLFTLALSTQVLPPKSKKPPKATLLQLLQEELFQPERIKRALAKLTDPEKAVLNRLLLHPDPVRTSAFRRELVRAKLATLAPETRAKANAYGYQSNQSGYEGDPNRLNSTVFEDLMARLTSYGLVFSQFSMNEAGSISKLTFHPGDELLVPAPVRQVLPPPTPVSAELTQWQPTRVEGGQAQQFLRELYLYWDFVRRNEVALLQSGLVGKRVWRTLSQVLLTPEPHLDDARDETGTGRLYLLRLVLQSLKLIQAQNGKLVISVPDRATIPSFWTDPTATQLQSCLYAWLSLSVPTLADPAIEHYYPQYPLARQLLLKTVRSQATDWRLLEDLLDAIATQNENFLFPDRTAVERQRHQAYYYSHRVAGSPAQLEKAFVAAEQRFVRTTLDLFFGMGLVDLGYHSETATQWSGVRLTTLGKAILATIDEAKANRRQTTKGAMPVAASAATAGRLVVQPNFQVLALGPVSLATLAQLDLFAERRSADLAVFEYHLSRESVYQGQQAGLHIDDVIAFLQSASAAPLPQNLARSLHEWGAQHERIVFRSGVSLLQASDPAMLEQLLGNAPIQKQIARVLAPGVALVRKGKEPPLLTTLLQQDRLPTISNDQPTAADHSIQIDPTGAITTFHRVPNLHLHGRLARIAELDDKGQWHLTPASVRRASGSRKKVLALLEELRNLQRGEVPAEVTTLVKQWGAYYGEVGATSVTLLEFRDPQALQELLTHPELQAHLTVFPAGNRALASVATKQLATVKRILQTLGVTVKEGLLS